MAVDEWADAPVGTCDQCGDCGPGITAVDPFVSEGIIDGPGVDEFWCRRCWE